MVYCFASKRETEADGTSYLVHEVVERECHYSISMIPNHAPSKPSAKVKDTATKELRRKRKPYEKYLLVKLKKTKTKSARS